MPVFEHYTKDFSLSGAATSYAPLPEANPLNADKPTGNDVGKANWIEAQLDVNTTDGTSETLDVTLEASLDNGVNWFTIITFTQATAATAERKGLHRTATAFLGNCLRAKYVVGGTDTPTFAGTLSILMGN
jgi:hypothetical protein